MNLNLHNHAESRARGASMHATGRRSEHVQSLSADHVESTIATEQLVFHVLQLLLPNHLKNNEYIPSL